MTKRKTLGQICRSARCKEWDDHPNVWDMLTDNERSEWENAARAVQREVWRRLRRDTHGLLQVEAVLVIERHIAAERRSGK